MVKLIKIENSPRATKRLRATFSDGTYTDFGQKGASTYIDHKNEKLKSNYIARHQKNENWNDYKSAGALARYILWEEPTLDLAIKKFKSRFRI